MAIKPTSTPDASNRHHIAIDCVWVVIRVSTWLNRAAKVPTTTPRISTKGISFKGVACNSGMLKAGSPPNTALDRAVATTAAIITGTKLFSAYSIMMTSSAKITPARGVLNDAAIPAAAPLATRVRILLLGNLKN